MNEVFIFIYYFLWLAIGLAAELVMIQHIGHTRKETVTKYMGAYALYTILGLLGVFTSQWPLFLFITVFGLLAHKFNNKYIRLLDSWICIIIILFTVINKYHLRLF